MAMKKTAGTPPGKVQLYEKLLKKTGELQKYFALSYAYVGSLKPKPTTRKE
jgi:hypothetical protein